MKSVRDSNTGLIPLFKFPNRQLPMLENLKQVDLQCRVVHYCSYALAMVTNTKHLTFPQKDQCFGFSSIPLICVSKVPFHVLLMMENVTSFNLKMSPLDRDGLILRVIDAVFCFYSLLPWVDFESDWCSFLVFIHYCRAVMQCYTLFSGAIKTDPSLSIWPSFIDITLTMIVCFLFPCP